MAEFRSDRLIMRDYITAMDHLQYTQLPDGIVAILLTHSNLQANHVDIRLDLHLSIADVKGKFRTHIGTHVEHQRLILKDQGRIICEMSDNTKMLGFYSVTSGMEIHVIDTDPFSLSRGGGLTDTSLVEKYRMSDEVYDKKSGTMRDFIRKKREANPDFKLPNSVVKAPKDPNAEPPPGPESVVGITVGARCQVMPGARRGVVMFVGPIEQIKPGYWVGIRLDEPSGLNNGTVRGVRIFECEEGYGSFLLGKNVTVGDFPERDLMDSDDEGAEKIKDSIEDEDEDEI